MCANFTNNKVHLLSTCLGIFKAFTGPVYCVSLDIVMSHNSKTVYFGRLIFEHVGSFSYWYVTDDCYDILRYTDQQLSYGKEALVSHRRHRREGGSKPRPQCKTAAVCLALCVNVCLVVCFMREQMQKWCGASCRYKQRRKQEISCFAQMCSNCPVPLSQGAAFPSVRMKGK